jgi:hypothetical protein
MADRVGSTMIHLDKSAYLAARQCARRLWLASFAPERATPPDAAVALRLERGREIGRRARALFPGGVLGGDDATAIARTRALVADPGVPAIFEAAFEHDGVRVHIDVLERLRDGTWGLREVKSSTRVKETHLDDVAVQRFVLDRCGVPTWSVEIVHVDRAYVRGGAGIDWHRYFTRVEVATEVAMRLADVPAHLDMMRAVLARAAVPDVEPSPHCRAPRRCEFWAHCTREKPDDWIYRLPRIDASLFAALRAAGVQRIGDIAGEVVLTPAQSRARDVWRRGERWVSRDLASALERFGPPAAYLDFETIAPAVPLYPGTRPYEDVPVQWSLHRIDASGGARHDEFLADGAADPRRAFVESLLAALADEDGPIIVYSDYEARMLAGLAATFPEHAAALGRVVARLADLLPVVREHVYDARFAGSFSLKSVAPALVPEFGYGDLDGIADGAAATAALYRRATETGDDERTRRALLAYCARDTEALVRLHRRLRALGTTGR